MIAILGSQSNARSVIHPQPSLLWLLHWHFQPLTSPQPFHTLVVHLPARIPQQCRDPAIAVTTILPGQLDHVSEQTLFVGTPNRQPSLRGSVLPQNTADPTLRHPHLVANVINAGPAARGAQKFPRAASVRMSLSKVRSDTARRNLSFSF